MLARAAVAAVWLCGFPIAVGAIGDITNTVGMSCLEYDAVAEPMHVIVPERIRVVDESMNIEILGAIKNAGLCRSNDFEDALFIEGAVPSANCDDETEVLNVVVNRRGRQTCSDADIQGEASQQ